MRKLILVLAIALIGLLPFGPASAQAPAKAQTTAVVEEFDPIYPFVLAAGAVTSVVIFNWLTSGYIGVLPINTSVVGTGSLVGNTATALSRVYAVTSAVVGGWIANWLYTGQ